MKDETLPRGTNLITKTVDGYGPQIRVPGITGFNHVEASSE